MLGRWESSISACEEVLERFGDSKEQDLQQYVARAMLIRGTALGATGNFEASIAALMISFDAFKTAKRRESSTMSQWRC